MKKNVLPGASKKRVGITLPHASFTRYVRTFFFVTNQCLSWKLSIIENKIVIQSKRRILQGIQMFNRILIISNGYHSAIVGYSFRAHRLLNVHPRVKVTDMSGRNLWVRIPNLYSDFN